MVPWMCELIAMDVSSIRSLLTLVVQLHTMIIFAQALSDEGAAKTKTKGDSNQKPCCFNGGLCVLGSFCHCPKNFYGRYCERELKDSPCGHIPHGSWVKAGCNLCRCFDGHMTCLPRAFDGCDDKPPKEKVDPWEYKDEMVIFATDASTTTKYDAEDEDYYDYYDDGSSDSGARTMRASAAVGVAACVFWTIALTRSWRLVS